LAVALIASPVGAAPAVPAQKPASAALAMRGPMIATPLAHAAAKPVPVGAVSKAPVSRTIAAKPAAVPAVKAAVKAPAAKPVIIARKPVVRASIERAQVIPIEAENGAYIVPVLVNGVLPLKFIIDSGSADVSIPADVASTLRQMGTMSGADLLGKKTYLLADGSQVSSEIYRVGSLKLGSLIMRDVTVRISAEKSSLLLGQSFLRRLTSWSMNNAKKVLIITGGA
jgi:clan AA aspartic protease (TIGR02281 family)